MANTRKLFRTSFAGSEFHQLKCRPHTPSAPLIQQHPIGRVYGISLPLSGPTLLSHFREEQLSRWSRFREAVATDVYIRCSETASTLGVLYRYSASRSGWSGIESWTLSGGFREAVWLFGFPQADDEGHERTARARVSGWWISGRYFLFVY